MGTVLLKRPVSSHPSTYQIKETLKAYSLDLMYGKHTEAVQATICYYYFINNEVYTYPDYLHTAIAGGETRENNYYGLCLHNY